MWRGVKAPTSADAEAIDVFNKSLVVTTVLSAPYTMLKLDWKQRTGNDRYEGFVVDLATGIARIVGFNFTIEPTDGYGSVDKNGRWNGMIREILEGVSKYT